MRTSGMYVVTMIWLLVGLCFGAAPVSAKVTVSQTSQADIYQFDIDNVTFEKTEFKGFGKAQLVGVNGYHGVQYQVGHPELPVIRLYVTGDVDVQFDQAANASIMSVKKTPAKLLPSQPSLAKIKNAKRPEFMMNQQAYANASFLPGKPYEMQNAGKIRGQTQKLLTLFPFQYNPATNEYKLIKRFKVVAKKTKIAADTNKEVFAFIVGKQFKESAALQTYVDFKKKMGYNVQTIPVDSNSTPESIRSTIKGIYTTSQGALKHALIIGDAADVPGYDSNHISGVTDHYYRAIDTDRYEDDINGPDIGIGRIAVANEDQLNDVIQKYIRYQKGTFSDQTWLNGAAFLATNDRYTVAEGSHNYAISTHTAAAGYVGFFPEANQAGGDKVYAITYDASDTDTQRVLQAGRTIINYSGHGGTTLWDSPSVSQEDVRNITDPNALPFVISNACITGDFRVRESFGETWQRHPNGAIMFWGSMDSSYWDEDDIMERRMYDGIYGNHLQNFHDITSFSLSEVWKFYGGAGKSKYYWETYVIFGDPSINLRTALVQNVNVNPTQPFMIGSGEASYNITNTNSQAVANARVALINEDGETLQVAYTNETGDILFTNVETLITAPQTLSLVITGENLALETHEVSVFAPDTAFLAAKDLTFNDHAPAFVGSLENVDVRFQLANVGGATSDAAELTLSKVSGPVTVTRSNYTVEAIEAGDSVSVENAIGFKIDANAANGEKVVLELKIKTGEGQEFTKTLATVVQRGQMSFDQSDFGTDWENGEGGIDIGGTGEVFVTIKNSGSLAITNATLTAEAGHCVSSVTGELTIASLAAGQTIRVEAPLQVTLNNSCLAGETAQVKLVGSYESSFGSLPLESTVHFYTGKVSQMLSSHENLDVVIVDNGMTTFDMDISNLGYLTDIGINVALEHSYMNDMDVSIVHPDGTTVMIQGRTRDFGTSLDQTYGLDGTAVEGLAALKGKPIQGKWQIKIQDHAQRDSGKLTKVILNLRGYIQK